MGLESVREKVAIITGGATGIGYAIARVFCENGMRVVIANRTASKGEAAVAALEEMGGKAVYCPTDVVSEESIKSCVEFAVKKYGQLDGIVNCAGCSATPTVLHEYTLEEYNRVIDINLKGVFLAAKYAAAEMVREGAEGFIINIASTAGIMTQPGMSLYSMSKHAVIALTKTAALDYAAQHITVNAICPGYTSSGHMEQASPQAVAFMNSLSPAKRMAKPEEHGYLALFLASDMARYINGTVIPVDGAYTAGLPIDLRPKK